MLQFALPKGMVKTRGIEVRVFNAHLVREALERIDARGMIERAIKKAVARSMA